MSLSIITSLVLADSKSLIFKWFLGVGTLVIAWYELGLYLVIFGAEAVEELGESGGDGISNSDSEWDIFSVFELLIGFKRRGGASRINR